MQKPKQIAFVRELCREKGEDEILEAEENFRGYLEVVMRICERREREESEALRAQDNADTASGNSHMG